jgi:hypothetical protein
METIKNLIEILKGGASLEFKSDMGKINYKAIEWSVLIIGIYLYCQSQIIIASLRYLHKQNEFLSPHLFFIPLIGFGACFLLMCLVHAFKNKFLKKHRILKAIIKDENK